MGLGVYNGANEKIGSIDDIVINPNGEIAKVVIGVGGFLGLGQKDVAVDFKAVRMDRDQNGKPTGHLEMTKDALKSEPTYVFYADTVNPNSPPASAPPRPVRTNP